MPPVSSDSSRIQGHVSAIIRLDVQSMPEKLDAPTTGLDHYSATPYRKSSRARIASLATIRSLLVTCTDLAAHLQGIARSEDLKEYADNRRSLLQRALPDSLFVFEYCQEILQLKGAVNTPTAAKLAMAAHQVCDLIDLIKSRVSTALEYRELKVNVLEDIRKFAMSTELRESDIEPLIYSLETTLPPRIELFAGSALPVFAKQVAHLQKLRKDLLVLANKRVREIKGIPNSKCKEPTSMDVPTKICTQDTKLRSPCRVKLPVLRGFKHRQQLSENHVRIISRAESDKAKFSPSHITSETPNNLSRVMKRPGSTIKENDLALQKSRIRPPTKIENRKVSGPTWKELYEPKFHTQHFREKSESSRPPLRSISNSRVDSRIPKPTEFKARPRTSSCSSKRSWGDVTNITYYNDSSVIMPSQMMLSSPETSFVADTPLALKGSAQLVRHGTSMNSLHIPRRRAHNF